jgi:hypothetical protein
MYVIERGKSAVWLCESSIEVFQARAVSLRIQGDIKDFNVFQQRLDNFECLNVGVIKVYKCSDATNCKDCAKYKGCEILQAVQETAKAHSEWVKWVESNGGYTF